LISCQIDSNRAFRRIVLDEGHLIKNHMSKTSVAVRALSGKYRWAITGTPIQNSLEEFFPYFAFLKVEHTGTFETFKRNFCKRGSALAMERLKVFLQKILVRRTHADEMFGRPILKLPKINHETIEVEFNEVERAIYRIVKARFINKIRAFSKADAIDKKYQQVFTLLLRLRQLAGHILLIAKTLKELMESEDIERLWRLTENEGKVADENRDLLKMLQQGLESATDTQQTARPDQEIREQDAHSPSDAIPRSTEVVDINENRAVGPSFRFRRYLKSLREDGRWEKIAQLSLCHYCNSIPKNPHITSCMHVYCLECLESIAYSAAQQENIKAKCIECGTEYEKVEPCRGFEEAALEDGSPVSVRSAGKKRKKSEGDEEDADWCTFPTMPFFCSPANT
jgi:SNF2 family DNA or RNA helicase